MAKETGNKAANRGATKVGFNYTIIAAAMAESGKQVNTLIAKAHKAAGSYRNAVQDALVAIALHAWRHGDWTGINTLLDGMPEGVGTTGISKWGMKFLGLEMVKAKDSDEKVFGNWKGKEHIERLFNGDKDSKNPMEQRGAKAVMFWEFAEPNPFRGYDFNQALLMALSERSRMLKRINDPKSNLSAEDKAKINTEANETTIQNLLKVTNFEVILNGKAIVHDEPPAPTATTDTASQAAPIAVAATH